ncbi:MAG: hypothetical protein GJ680_06880 [Alteromonadaceae bacterium]|nr:hypothetical protein [Alteromonadaceae bacterium]
MTLPNHVPTGFFKQEKFDEDAVVEIVRIALSQHENVSTELLLTAWNKFISPYVYSDSGTYDEKVVDICCQILTLDTQNLLSTILFDDCASEVKLIFEYGHAVELTGIVTYRFFSSSSSLLDEQGYLCLEDQNANGQRQSTLGYSVYLFLPILLRRLSRTASLLSDISTEKHIYRAVQRLALQLLPTLIYVGMKGELKQSNDILTSLHIGDKLMY